MSFRNNLREILDFTGMEQKELAARTGLSLKTIENYVKKDSSIPSADKAVLMAQALGVTVEYLVTGKESEKKETARHAVELISTLEQLDDYNYDIIVSMAKLLLNLQKKKN
jgi:transcriptional regulator with XRE-family HTH domain